MRPRSVSKHRLPCGGNRCDFCSAPFVFNLYPCHNFDWQGQSIFAGHFGRWAACETCSGLVDRGEWRLVEDRVMRQVKCRKGVTRPELKELRADLRVLYLVLRVNLRAEALRVSQPHLIRTSGPVHNFV